MTITLDDLARMARTDAKALRAASPFRNRGKAAEESETASSIAADPALQAMPPLAGDTRRTAPPDLPGWE